MPSGVDRWQVLEGSLRQLGVSSPEHIKRTRDEFTQASSTGAHLLPDFTLHNVTHSDNLIMLLASLQKIFGFQLSAHEAEVLTISVYLHDLGMFFSKTRWEKIIPNIDNELRFCPSDACDHPRNYNLRGKDIGTQIRLIHNLLSAHWLLNCSHPVFGIEPDDLGYIVSICRGHRIANLKEKGCTCYHTKAIEGQGLRLGILTSFIRLADALDFFNNRTPKIVFEQRALDFLSNPIALEHWLKHYFVSDPNISKDSKGYSPTLICTLYFTVPMKYINGISYSDFFRPLFVKHVAELNDSDFNAEKYPSDFLGLLGISDMKADLVEDINPGYRELPSEIASTIEESGCQNILDFLKWLPERASAISVVQENIQFLEEITHQIVAPLAGIQGGCENLLNNLDDWDRERTIRQIENILFQARWATRLARNFAFAASRPIHIIPANNFVDFADLIRKCVRDVDGIAKWRNVSLRVNLDSIASTPKVQIDISRFSQALVNILDNAIKYSDVGAEVVIKARNIRATKNLHLEISNYGIPIREEDVERIFERGYRTPEALTTTGSGIGLFVARDIMRLLGGNIIAVPSIHQKGQKGYKTTLIIMLSYSSLRGEERQ